MLSRLVVAQMALLPLACPAVRADEMPDLGEIPSEIEALATDPMAVGLPSPVPQRKLVDTPRSPFFYVLPVIGFWLILRRRNRGVRL